MLKGKECPFFFLLLADDERMRYAAEICMEKLLVKWFYLSLSANAFPCRRTSASANVNL